MVFYFILGTFVHHFQIKSSTHGSNFNSVFVSMGDLDFFSLIGVLTQNSNIVELVKFLEKSKSLHSNHSGHIENDIMQNLEQKRVLGEKMKTQDSMGKTNFFFST
jgi:hypothetical protein